VVSAIRHTLRHLDHYLLEFEKNCTAAGGVVHWARDAAEANDIVVKLVQATGVDSVVKVKSMATAEIELNVALEKHGITAHETAAYMAQTGRKPGERLVVPSVGAVVWSPLGWGKLTGKIRRGQPLPKQSRLQEHYYCQCGDGMEFQRLSLEQEKSRDEENPAQA